MLRVGTGRGTGTGTVQCALMIARAVIAKHSPNSRPMLGGSSSRGTVPAVSMNYRVLHQGVVARRERTAKRHRYIVLLYRRRDAQLPIALVESRNGLIRPASLRQQAGRRHRSSSSHLPVIDGLTGRTCEPVMREASACWPSPRGHPLDPRPGPSTRSVTPSTVPSSSQVTCRKIEKM